MQPLIDPRAQLRDPTKADTAIFYSINNCQKGLRGVSFGSFLIKQVAAELQAELPNLRTFATLSPVPRFREWLAGRSRTAPTGAEPEPAAAEADIERKLDALDPLADPDVADALRKPVSAACARYLLHAKREDGLPYDPVARFHLGNGARLERLNWLGDTSPKGLRQSAGIMVNYLYELDQLERNHEAFVNRQEVVAARSVVQLAKSAPRLTASA